MNAATQGQSKGSAIPARERRIALLGWYGSKNAGDEAVLQSVVGSLKAARFNNVLVLSTDPEGTAARYDVDSVPRSPLSRQTLSAFVQCSALVLGGGGLIQDSSSAYNLPLYAFFVALARLRRMQVIGWGLGAGPLHTRLGKWLASFIVRSSCYFSVRDSGAQRTLGRAGISPGRVVVSADPAFLIEAAEHERDEQAPSVVFCVRHRLHDAPGLNLRYLLPVSMRHRLHLEGQPGAEEDARFATAVARGVKLCVEQFGARVVLLPLWAERDDEVLRQIEQEALALGVPQGMLSWAQVEHTPSSLATYLARADVLVSMRLHALIFAAGTGVPLLALSYVPKVRALMRLLGSERWTVEVGTRVPSPEEIEMKLAQLWALRQQEGLKLARKAAILKKRATEDAVRISELLMEDQG